MTSFYEWNNMFNFLMNIKHQYTGEKTSFKNMCKATGNEQFLLDSYVVEKETKHGRFVLVKYNLLNGMTDIYTNKNSIYREGRSLVINLDAEEIVLCPFRKFFNINEIPEMEMSVVLEQIKNARMVEFSNKLDGSMQQFRRYRGDIVYSGSTSLSPENSFQLEKGKEIFFLNPSYSQLCFEYPDYTFIFECIIEEDRHVVNYEGNSLNLIGARNVYDGSTFSYRELLRIAKEFNLPATTIEETDLQKCIDMKSKYKSNEKEGWVIHIVHPGGNSDRYKFKCDDYIAMHHILNDLSSPNEIIRWIAAGKFDDIMSRVPFEYKDRINEKAAIVYKYVRMHNVLIDYFYDLVKNEETDKAFALAVKDKVDSYFIKYMFMLRKNKTFNVLCKYDNHYEKMENIQNFIKKNEDMYNSVCKNA